MASTHKVVMALAHMYFAHVHHSMKDQIDLICIWLVFDLLVLTQLESNVAVRLCIYGSGFLVNIQLKQARILH